MDKNIIISEINLLWLLLTEYKFEEKFKSKPAEEYDFKEIIFEKNYDTWTARVTMNRPHEYNAYTTEMLREMSEAFLDVSWDDGIGAVVFFCGGRH